MLVAHRVAWMSFSRIWSQYEDCKMLPSYWNEDSKLRRGTMRPLCFPLIFLKLNLACFQWLIIFHTSCHKKLFGCMFSSNKFSQPHLEPAIRNLDKLPPCAPSAVRQAADLKLKETVQQQQSIMSIMPGLVLKKVNTNPSPVSLSCIGKKVPFSTSAEERKRQRPKAGVVPSMKTSNGATANIKSGTLCSKIVTNIKETDIQGHVHRGSAPRPASLSVTNIEGSVKAVAPRPNRVSSGRRESASNTTITGFQTKAQNELPRIPLRDRSNSAAKVVRK